ncbi:glycosyltransferase family 2 protein [Coraliomargarita sp. W4R72]
MSRSNNVSASERSNDSETPAMKETSQLELSVVMPCLNESKTLKNCIQKALTSMAELNVHGEVVVADNGSTDGSIEIAEANGARVVHVPIRGYGAALAAGIHSAKGKFVIMGDADETYDFSKLGPFVEGLREGYDLVQGNRFQGGIEAGAMPPMHRYFGNPVLSGLGRFLFRANSVGDFYCGLRGFRKDKVEALSIQSSGMEFALEMIVKSSMHGLKIKEVATTLSVDAKDRVPHLRTYRDGWRSLRFFLTMSPHWVFTLPGILLSIVGFIGCALLFPGNFTIGSITFGYHTLVYASAALIMGNMAVLLGVVSKLIAAETGLHPNLSRLSFLKERPVMERLLFLSLFLFTLALGLGIASFMRWANVDYGTLDQAIAIRYVIGSVLSLILGGQIFMAAFFFSTINMLVERRLAVSAQK